MKFFICIKSCLIVLSLPLFAQDSHESTAQNIENGANAESSPAAIRAATVNRYISNPQQQYSPQYFANQNEHGKIQLQLVRPEVSLGVFSSYGGLNIDALGPAGDNGKPLFLHYNSPRIERDGRDAWGEPQTICSVLVYAARWKEHCMKKYGNEAEGPCTLQIGDISLPHRSLSTGGRCALGHRTHFNGNCVDMRPLDPKRLISGQVTRKSNAAAVQRTQEAVDFAVSMGATNPIWQSAGHFDHFHVCFPLGNTPDRSLSQAIHEGPLAGCYALSPDAN
jgi:hypothetical protein